MKDIIAKEIVDLYTKKENLKKEIYGLKRVLGEDPYIIIKSWMSSISIDFIDPDKYIKMMIIDKENELKDLNEAFDKL